MSSPSSLARLLQYFDAKEKSKQQLEIAKTAVEPAIETDETTAMTGINEQLEALGIELT